MPAAVSEWPVLAAIAVLYALESYVYHIYLARRLACTHDRRSHQCHRGGVFALMKHPRAVWRHEFCWDGVGADSGTPSL